MDLCDIGIFKEFSKGKILGKKQSKIESNLTF